MAHSELRPMFRPSCTHGEPYVMIRLRRGMLLVKIPKMSFLNFSSFSGGFRLEEQS